MRVSTPPPPPPEILSHIFIREALQLARERERYCRALILRRKILIVIFTILLSSFDIIRKSGYKSTPARAARVYIGKNGHPRLLIFMYYRRKTI